MPSTPKQLGFLPRQENVNEFTSLEYKTVVTASTIYEIHGTGYARSSCMRVNNSMPQQLRNRGMETCDHTVSVCSAEYWGAPYPGQLLHSATSGNRCTKLQALVYDICPPSAAITDCAIGLEKVLASRQIFVACSSGSNFVTDKLYPVILL